MNASTLSSVPDSDIRVSISAELLEALDKRVARDKTTREEIVRQALDELLYREQRQAEARAAAKARDEEEVRKMVEAYTRMPQTPEEWDWSDVIQEEEETGKRAF